MMLYIYLRLCLYGVPPPPIFKAWKEDAGVHIAILEYKCISVYVVYCVVFYVDGRQLVRTRRPMAIHNIKWHKICGLAIWASRIIIYIIQCIFQRQ